SPDAQVDGTSLKPLIEGRGSRDFAYNEWNLRPGRVGVALDLRTVRTQRYRMTHEVNSESGELYDFQEDPHEMINRFEDASYSHVRRELSEMIASIDAGRLKNELPVVGTA